MKCLFGLATILIALTSACGKDVVNPYDASANLPTEEINASYARLEHKIVDSSINSGILIGSQPAIDAELWLYDGDDAVVAKFPMRWRMATTGVNFYLWWKTKNIIGLKGLNGIKASDLLGGYSGFETGVAVLAGQTDYKGSNGPVGMRMIIDRGGMGLEFGVTRVDVSKGSAEQTHSWDSTLNVASDNANWN